MFRLLKYGEIMVQLHETGTLTLTAAQSLLINNNNNNVVLGSNQRKLVQVSSHKPNRGMLS